MISRETRDRLLAFRAERDWQQFHTPKNLAASVAKSEEHTSELQSH